MNPATLAAILFLGSSAWLVRIMRPQRRAEAVLQWFLFTTAQVIGCGYVLSGLRQLARPAAWLWASAGGMVLVASAALLLRGRQDPARHADERVSRPVARDAAGGLGRVALAGMLLTVVGLGILQLLVVVRVAPGNWDSMTYHLARVAYYLQQGHLGYYDANYWAQVTHAKNATVLLLFTYLAAGRDENLMQLVQYACYWVCVLAVFAAGRRLGFSRPGSLFAALAFALLPESLMQATTTQNDLVIAAYAGCATCFLLSFRQTRAARHLSLAGLAVALALGVKISALTALPGLTLVALWALWRAKPRAAGMRDRRFALRPACVALPWLALCAAGFVLPAGYVENYVHFGHPAGPAAVRAHHTFAGRSARRIAGAAARNCLRFGVDFLALDGFPPHRDMRKAQRALRAPLAAALRWVGADLERAEAGLPRFSYAKPPVAHEDLSSWGLLGFALLWPAVLLALLARRRGGGERALAGATLGFLVAESLRGPYEPWRLRYFLTAAVLAAPLLARCCPRSGGRRWPGYGAAVGLLGCLAAGGAVLYHRNSPLLPIDPRRAGVVWGLTTTPVWKLDRLEQLTRNRPLAGRFREFERRVPPGACVAVFWGPDNYEYPLFGPRLTRRIIPLNSCWRRVRRPPARAEYLLYSRGYVDYFQRHGGALPAALLPRPDDAALGGDWFLRRLLPAPAGRPPGGA